MRVVSNQVVFAIINYPKDALIKLMDSDFTGPIYIGNPDWKLNISKLAKNIRKKFNFDLEIKIMFLPENFAKNLKPNFLKANNLFNWEQSTNLDQGSNKDIENFKLKI